MDTNQTEFISKTVLKKESKDIQDFGKEIAQHTEEKIKKFDFSSNITDAIIDLKNIKSNSAKKRQVQYLGKLLREIDLTEAYSLMQQFKFGLKKEMQRNRLIEEWRDKLINNESELTEFINQYPNTDVQELRQLILNAQKEIKNNKGNKCSRQLYKLLRDFIIK